MLGLTAFLDRAPGGRAGGRAPGARWPSGSAGDTATRPTADWRWFEPALTYDNALLPLALLRAHALTGDPASREVAREALEFLEDDLLSGRPPGPGRQRRLARRGARSRADADEQPIDAAAFVLAFRGAYLVTGDTATCGGCASRSPGSWAPTAWALRSTTRPPPDAATASGAAAPT